MEGGQEEAAKPGLGLTCFGWTRLLGLSPVSGALGCRVGPGRVPLVPLSPTLPPSEGTGGAATAMSLTIINRDAP